MQQAVGDGAATMIGVLLALGASGAWGLSDFLAGVRTRTMALPAVLLISQLTGTVVLTLGVWGRAGTGSGLTPLPGTSMIWAALAGAAGVTALGLAYLAMARAGIAIVAPLAAVATALPVAFGLLQGETLTPRAVIGILFTLAGTCAAAFPDGPGHTHWADAGGLLAAAGSALCTGAFFVLMRAASTQDPMAATLTNRACAGVLVSAWALGRWRQVAEVRRARPLALLAVGVVGIGDATAEWCFAAASTQVPLSVVSPLSSLYPAVAVLLALVVLRERLRPVGVAGVTCALIGVVLLAGG